MKLNTDASEFLESHRRRTAIASATNHVVMLRVKIAVVVLCLCPVSAKALEPVRAEIGVESAWVGEAVPLIVTLYSPGPFGEAASFSLPEMSRTVILKSGNPVVGSESLDGKTVLTQRHEFKLYTRLAGQVTVPPFKVRFSGKASFTSEPEPVEGLTSELSLRSKRPPGIDAGSRVITADSLAADQQWTPDSVDEKQSNRVLLPGDVVQRRVTQTATGTTAMFLEPLPEAAPDGVQLHTADPVVTDRDERGESSAQRIDVLKYQFQKPGTYDLPAVTLRWWDARSEKVQQLTLAGRTVQVDAAASSLEVPAESEAEPSASWWWLVGLGSLGVVVWRPVVSFTERVRRWHNQPERLAARRLLTACWSNDFQEACVALIEWKRVLHSDGRLQRLDTIGSSGGEFDRLADELTRRVYGAVDAESSWSGAEFAHAFQSIRKALRSSDVQPGRGRPLPALNPLRSESATS